jgi:bifunctional non-homologous end joining protein LigD
MIFRESGFPGFWKNRGSAVPEGQPDIAVLRFAETCHNRYMKSTKKSDGFAFVVQKHKATRDHYDFRLEIGGAMPSWAVPKGPTLDPAMKRLAMETPVHDLEYRHFEGVIAEGEIGAGTVMIWDEGTYIPEVEISKGVRKTVPDLPEGTKVMADGLVKGELKFTLLGHKLKGSFALVKTHGFGPKNSWLLIKHKDAHTVEGYDAHAFDVSVTTKRSMEEITEANRKP